MDEWGDCLREDGTYTAYTECFLCDQFWLGHLIGTKLCTEETTKAVNLPYILLKYLYCIKDYLAITILAVLFLCLFSRNLVGYNKDNSIKFYMQMTFTFVQIVQGNYWYIVSLRFISSHWKYLSDVKSHSGLRDPGTYSSVLLQSMRKTFHTNTLPVWHPTGADVHFQNYEPVNTFWFTL